MGNHKRNKSPRHITKYGTKYKTKGNRHEMHSVKWVVHVCKSRGNKWYRERENSQRNEQRSCIFRLPQKKLHLLNLTPSDLWQEQYHIWSTQTYHLCPIIWKLLVHHSVSKSLCQMLNDLSNKVQLPRNLWFRNNDALCWKWCQHLLIQFRDDTKITCQMDTWPCRQTAESL